MSSLPDSPRKRQKFDHHPTVNITEASDPIAPSPAADSDRLLAMASVTASESQHVKEAEVGILDFVAPDLPGFSGILKKRYTDFLVNEILPTGEVVHLRSLKPPRNNVSTTEQGRTPPKAGEAPVEGTGAKLVKSDDQPQEPLKAKAKNDEDANGVAVEDAKPALDATVAEKPQEVGKDAAGPGLPEQQLELDVPNRENLAKWQSYARKHGSMKLKPEDEAALCEVLDLETVTAALALFNKVIDNPHRRPKDYGFVSSRPIEDKGARTKAHQIIRHVFAGRLESSTDENNAMVLGAAMLSSSLAGSSRANQRGRDKNRGQGGRPARDRGGRPHNYSKQVPFRDLGGDYLHFTLFKENKDTMEVVAYLSRQLNVQPRSFQFAGTKDRRAAAVQRISVYRIYAERMAQVGRTLRGSAVGDFEYLSKGLELGDLKGNEFVISLRECEFNIENDLSVEDRRNVAMKVVQSAVERLKERGFINYYGLQRFGTFVRRTDSTGMKMLQGDFKGAVESILDYTNEALDENMDGNVGLATAIARDDRDRARAICAFREGDVKKALNLMPKKFSAETNVIRTLSSESGQNNYLGALQSVSRNLRLMYVHAYQSLIWNLAATRRWKTFGDRAVEGDLVLVREHKESRKSADLEEVDADGEVVVRPAAEDSAARGEERFERARALTREEIEGGKFTAYDVVVPTPGWDILYPEHMKSFYEETMGSEEYGRLNPHDMRRSWKDISLSGSYRKLLARPPSMGFEVRSYVEDNQQFVQTDLEKLKRGTAPTASEEEANAKVEEDGGVLDVEVVTEQGITNEKQMPSEEAAAMTKPTREGTTELAEQDPHSDEPGAQDDTGKTMPRLAVILKMQLGSSQYATMALRELMKGGLRVYKQEFSAGR